MDATVSSRFRSHFRAAAETVSQGVSSGRAAASIGQWEKWIDFCSEMGLDPFLEAFEDKIPILQVFIHRVRIGELAASGNQIKSRSVEDYLRAVAQTFLAMGSDDPRLNAALKTDFRLARMLAAWKKQDPQQTGSSRSPWQSSATSPLSRLACPLAMRSSALRRT